MIREALRGAGLDIPFVVGERANSDFIRGLFGDDQWERYLTCYVHDFQRRRIAPAHARFNASGYVPADIQEILLLPPPHGLAGIDQRIFDEFELSVHMLCIDFAEQHSTLQS